MEKEEKANKIDIEKAKQMFFKWDCNHFYMWKDGVIEKYESYGISKEQEAKWLDEYVKLKMDEFYTNSTYVAFAKIINLFILQKNSNCSEILLDMLKKAKKYQNKGEFDTTYRIFLQHIDKLKVYDSNIEMVNEQAKQLIK